MQSAKLPRIISFNWAKQDSSFLSLLDFVDILNALKEITFEIFFWNAVIATAVLKI